MRAALEIPAERVLVSDFDLWHVPLNDGYLSVDRADDEAFDREARERAGRRYPRWYEEDFPEDLRRKLLDSWERIFPDRWGEVEDPDRSGAEPGGRGLQACVEEIKPEDVVGMERFVTRRGAWERQVKRGGPFRHVPVPGLRRSRSAARRVRRSMIDPPTFGPRSYSRYLAVARAPFSC